MPSDTAIPRPDAAETGNPVADFDIEAWRKGRRTPVRVVPVTNDPGAGIRLTELRHELAQIRAELAAAKAEGRKVAGARAGSTTTPELEAAHEEMRAILADLDGSWSYVHVRSLSSRELNALSDIENRMERLEASLASVDKRGRPAATLSASDTEPGAQLTAEEWGEILDDIGQSQTLKLEAALTELTVAAVTPDFSQRVSSLLDGATSSSS